MAAPITTNATTLEGQLMEIITAIQVKENDSASNPQNLNLVTANTNLDTGNFNATVNLSITTSVGSSGSLVIEAESYLDI